MYQLTMPTAKDEGRDDHSAGFRHTTQPASKPKARSFFERMTKKGTPSSVKPQVTEPMESCPLSRPMLQRSPSLPTIREDVHQHPNQLDRKRFSFGSPKNDQSDHLRRSPSMPSMQKPNQLKHSQVSPLAPAHASKRATTPSSVPQNVVYSNVSATPMQKETPGINRAPLQCITPLNQKELIFSHGMVTSNRKTVQSADKENVFTFDGKQENDKECQGKYFEPTPEMKKSFLQMPENHSSAFSTRGWNANPVSVVTKTARNLFLSEGISPKLLQPSENEFPINQPDTPALPKIRAHHHEFKQPNLPMQRPKDSPNLGYILVNNIAYRKGVQIGKGGSSEVIQVFRSVDDAELALKIVNLKDADHTVRQGFLEEISFLKRMQGCERVIQLIDHEYCEEQELLLVIMEKGVRDLSSFLKDRAKRKDLRISTLKEFWRDMVVAVSAIHSQGIIHSDLKPANFILCGEVGFHQLKIIDFGIASSIQTDMTSVIKEHPAGTVNYMSPEALQGTNAKINFKSDVWSLGCILYCLLYGCTPFQHIKNYNQKAAIITNPNHEIRFPEKSQILPDDGFIPQGLINTMRMCLSFQPQDRPSTQDLLDIKYCGCEKQTNALEVLAEGLSDLIKESRIGQDLAQLLVAALQSKKV